jgi:hypothetical protein
VVPNRIGDQPHGGEREAAQAPSLEQRDGCLVDPARGFDVRLPPPLADTRGTNESPDSAIIHEPMIRMAAYQSLTDG